MSGPFIFIATNRLREGMVDAERERVAELRPFIEENERQLLATTSIRVYGEPSNAVLAMLSRQAGAGVPMTVKRHHIGGFSRTRLA